MFEIKTKCEYGDVIRLMFQQQFPLNSLKKSSDVLELLTDAIVGSGKVRFGSRPNVESLYSIRQHIMAMMEHDEPIRFLAPWGSEKPAHSQIVDVAEVAALKTMSSLSARVKEVYSPGIQIRLRIEDATAPNLFHLDREQARADAALYVSSFERLIKVLDLAPIVTAVKETSMITEGEFEKEFEKIYSIMLDYLIRSEDMIEAAMDELPAYEALVALGWKGIIPIEQREHYRGVYQRLYDMDSKRATAMLARYLSQALARNRLKMLGNLDWTDFLGLTFVAPVPGEPKGRTARRVYYRTLPENLSSLHMPAWRAKGYIQISDAGARTRLASWGEPREYHPNSVTLTNGDLSTTVQCDYEVV